MRSLYESLLDDEDDVVDKLDTKALIEHWLKKYNIKNYKINKDNTIDVRGDVDLSQYPEKEFPKYIQFRNVADRFSVTDSKLNTLKGCPKEVVNFYCYNCNSLISLEGAPEIVEGEFDCSNCNSLTSLKGAPKKVGRGFYCIGCSNLTSLKGAPKEVEWYFYCVCCEKLNVTEEDIKKICKVGKEIYI